MKKKKNLLRRTHTLSIHSNFSLLERSFLELMLLTVIPCCILAALSSEQFTEVVGTNDPADVPAAAAWLSEPPVKYNADFASPLPLIYERALLNADLTKRVATPPPNTWVLESQTNSSVAKTTVSHDHPGGILNISNNGALGLLISL